MALPAIPHKLALKVLRLQRPTIHQAPPSHQPYTDNASSVPLSSYLALPTSFGACHLGETFTALISANNESDQIVQRPSLRVEMQTSSAKLLLYSSDELEDGTVESLAPGESIQAKVELEIRELGQHALACTVAYAFTTDADEDQQQQQQESFRKTYKFSTSNPLGVKTKILASRNNLVSFSQSDRETSFLEVQIQNLSRTVLSFSRITFDPTPGLTHTSTSNPDPDYLDFLYPSDVRQLLYIVKPSEQPSSSSSDSLFKAATVSGSLALGRLDIEWRGQNGTTGRLQTSQLYRKLVLQPQPILTPDISSSSSLNVPWEIFVVDPKPREIKIGRPFKVRYRIQVSDRLAQEDSDPAFPSVLRLTVTHLPVPPQHDIEQSLASALAPHPRSNPNLDPTQRQHNDLQPSSTLTVLSISSIRLPPIRKPQTHFTPRKLSRVSILSTETDATDAASTESNTPLSVLVERAISRSQSQASFRPDNEQEPEDKELPDIEEDNLSDHTDFEVVYVADSKGLINIGPIRIGLTDDKESRLFCDYPVVMQVYVS